MIASVAFQYGNLSIRTPHFWRQVPKGDWFAALEN
ncbi:pesticin C-terminus-like muramidase [uncultured Shewanella sp.]